MFQRVDILIALIIISVIIISILKLGKENYQQMNFCAKKFYGPFAKYALRTECIPYGYVIPRENPLEKPIKMWKCKIGLPSDSLKYKIYIDDIVRYTDLEKYTDFGPVVGQYLKFDNNKEYQLIELV